MSFDNTNCSIYIWRYNVAELFTKRVWFCIGPRLVGPFGLVHFHSNCKWPQMCLGQLHFDFHLQSIYEMHPFWVWNGESRATFGHPSFLNTLSSCSLSPNLWHPKAPPENTSAASCSPTLDCLSTSWPVITPMIHLLSWNGLKFVLDTNVMANGRLRARRKVVLKYYFRRSVASSPLAQWCHYRRFDPRSPLKRPLVVALTATSSAGSNTHVIRHPYLARRFSYVWGWMA